MSLRTNGWFQDELFGVLTDGELDKIAPLCSHFVAVEDALIFREGHAATYLYVVTEGQIALQKSLRVPHRARSRRTTITICRPGEIVGWSALVEPYKYTLSAVAWEPSKMLRIESRRFRKALDVYPDIGYKIMRSLSGVTSRRLRQITDALTNERELSFARIAV